MTTEYEESPGVVSMMRVGVAVSLRAGAALIAASVASTGAMIALNRPELGTIALGLAASGSGLIAAALGAKGWQAQAEARAGK
ncbi:MAG: hypothetical protein KKB59_14085 [Spirochaetes bacterium]|nr:hypothetical protein [Spirochaetota bacterium]